MASCPACGANVADGAAFCGSCGRPMAAGAQTASGAVAAPRTSADAERMRQAAVEAKNAFVSLGAEKITCIVGGLLGAVGTLLPFYTLPSEAVLGDTVGGGSESFLNQGGTGFLVLALAIVLGAAPAFMALSRAINLAGFGIAMAVIGLLIGDRTVSFMGQSVPLDFGFGYYLMFLGFLVLAYAYGRGASSS